MFIKNKNLDIVISKSGSTLETIVNQNIFSKSKKLFITENKKSYLNDLAKRLKSEIIEHRNFVGGRYSALSEVGMLPAELLGLKSEKFKKFDNLIKNKNPIKQIRFKKKVFLIFPLWTPDLLIFDLKIGFLVKNCIYSQFFRSGSLRPGQNMRKLIF